ncbi:MAG: hypothetical protein M3220_07730, partial [Chloroflexota bacterium]|nr:hypothetical protein [Chloroflexota bacterium]
MEKYIVIVLTLLMLLVVGCATEQPTGIGPAATEEAQELPEEAQAYIEMSREALAEQLDIPPEEIMLDSVTSPTEVDGTYIIQLEVGDELYEFHGREGEVLLVSDPLPLAPDTQSNANVGGASGEMTVKSIVMAEPGTTIGEQDPYTIQNAAITEDVLEVQVSYSGGCEEHTFDLIWEGGFEESNPVQAPLTLVH